MPSPPPTPRVMPPRPHTDARRGDFHCIPILGASLVPSAPSPPPSTCRARLAPSPLPCVLTPPSASCRSQQLSSTSRQAPSTISTWIKSTLYASSPLPNNFRPCRRMSCQLPSATTPVILVPAASHALELSMYLSKCHRGCGRRGAKHTDANARGGLRTPGRRRYNSQFNLCLLVPGRVDTVHRDLFYYSNEI